MHQRRVILSCAWLALSLAAACAPDQATATQGASAQADPAETVLPAAQTIPVDAPPTDLTPRSNPDAGSALPASSSAPPESERPPAAVALAYLIGDVDASRDPLFVRVPSRLSSREGMYGHRDAVEALIAMSEAARVDGVNLKVVSAFRSLADQKRIWNDKWTGRTRVEGGRLPETVPDPATRALKILEYSAMPGASRHHWGTDFDFNNLNNAWFESGEGKQIHDWLTANAARYGFCQTYTAKGPDRPQGYNEERWHWTYVPVAERMLSAYLATVGYDQLQGFEGASTARGLDILNRYVQGINPACRQ